MADGGTGVFTNIFTLIDENVVNVVTSKVGNIIPILEPLLLSGFTVYLLFLFWSYWNSQLEESISDLGKKTLAWIVILGFSLNISTYNEYVVPVVMGFGDFLSHKFSGSDTTINGNLDDMLFQIIGGIQKTLDEAKGVSGTIVALITIVLVSVASIVFLIISAGYILLAKVFLSLLVVIGPIFISLALFPATRQYFSSWLNAVLNYTILTFCIQVLMALFLGFMQSVVGEGYIDLMRGFNIVVGAGIFFVILLKLPDFATSVSNGGISATGFTDAYKRATGVKDFFSKDKSANPKNKMEKA